MLSRVSTSIAPSCHVLGTLSHPVSIRSGHSLSSSSPLHRSLSPIVACRSDGSDPSTLNTDKRNVHTTLGSVGEAWGGGTSGAGRYGGRAMTGGLLQLRVVRVFKSTLEDMEERLSAHSAAGLRSRLRGPVDVPYIDAEDVPAAPRTETTIF